MEKDIRIGFTEKAKHLLATRGFDPLYGARPLKRVIQNDILDPLALEVIEGKVPAEGILVDVDKAGFTFGKQSGKPKKTT